MASAPAAASRPVTTTRRAPPNRDGATASYRSPAAAVVVVEDLHWIDAASAVFLEELVEATAVPKQNLCRACFDGVYPVDLPEPEHLGKHLLEPDPAVRHPDGLAASLAGGGAGDALDRP